MCGTMKQDIACKIHHNVHRINQLFLLHTHIGLQAYPTLLPLFQHPWQGHLPLKVTLMQLAPHILMHVVIQWFPCHYLQVWPLSLDQLFQPQFAWNVVLSGGQPSN